MPRGKPQFNRSPADHQVLLAPPVKDFDASLVRRIAALCPKPTSGAVTDPARAMVASKPRAAKALTAEPMTPMPPVTPAPAIGATSVQVGKLAKAMRRELAPVPHDYRVPGRADGTFQSRELSFAHAVLAEARFAVEELRAAGQALTLADLQAEVAFFASHVGALIERLPSMSPEVANLQDFDPRTLADQLAPVAASLRRSAEQVRRLPRRRRADEVRREVEVELAIRVLRVCRRYGMRITVGSARSHRLTAPQKIMTTVGDATQLNRSPETWRDVIAQAVRTAPDLV